MKIKFLSVHIYTNRSHIIPVHGHSTQNFPPEVPSVPTDDNTLKKAGSQCQHSS